MEFIWDDLEQFCREIEEADSAAAERRAQVGAERQTVQPVLDLIERQWQEFGLERALEHVRERLLGGRGVVQRVASDYGLERMVALMWPAEADPRAELAAVAGEYRVEVWLGIGDQGRARVRVVGARRMEAMLPVPAEKFRDVLLGAVRSPAFLPVEGERQDAPPPESVPATPESPVEPLPTPPAGDESIAMGPSTIAPSAADAESSPAPPRQAPPPEEGAPAAS